MIRRNDIILFHNKQHTFNKSNMMPQTKNQQIFEKLRKWVFIYFYLLRKFVSVMQN